MPKLFESIVQVLPSPRLVACVGKTNISVSLYFKFVADRAGFEFEDDDTTDLQTVNYTSLSEEPRQLVSAELPQASSKPIQSVEIMFRPQNPSDDDQNIK